MINLDDRYRVNYLPKVTLVFKGVNRKDKTYVFEYLTGHNAGKKLIVKETDAPSMMKHWTKIEDHE